MYVSESKFSHALCTALKKRGIMLQRIESGVTGDGIPDLYLRSQYTETWIELKNMKTTTIYCNHYTIPWRPGQQAWASEYRLFTKKRVTYTAVALKDGYLLIPMTKHFVRKEVKAIDCIRMTKLVDLVDQIMHINAEG